MLDAALDYARRGWPVFPLWWPTDGPKRCACSKAQCGTPDPSKPGELLESPAKHPITQNGLDNATVDLEVVRAWWTRHPLANIGIRTGIAFDVLDIDNAAAGQWLARYADQLGEDTATCWAHGPMSITGKGSHLLYTVTGPCRTGVEKVTGFDWRGHGGYIVAPPSRHVSGRTYAWHEHCGPEHPIPTAPAFLAALINRATQPPPATPSPMPAASWITGAKTEPQGPRWSALGIIGKVATAAHGSRNDVLNWAAHKIGRDVATGRATLNDATSALEQLATAAERAGLTADEVTATIRSGYRTGAGIAS